MLLRNLIHLKHSVSSLVRNFVEETKGYAIALALAALPFIVGVAAFVIDASRIANLHTDLQHATDAMALAGARELDGRNDAVNRALAAIEDMAGNEAWFGDGGGPNSDNGNNLGTQIQVTFDSTNLPDSDVIVSFLGAIPASDDTKIGPGACTTSGSAPNNGDCTAKGSGSTLSNNAKYVRVIARPKNVRTIFPLPGFGRDDVPVSAEAVATYTAAACDVTPIFVCNPFEETTSPANPLYNGLSFGDNFAAGNLYGREVTMVQSGTGDPPGPGNFGYLRVDGSGGNELGQALGTSSPGVCYEQDGLDTEPGVTWGKVESNLNTRFGIYASSAGPPGGTKPDSLPDYRPDTNVRSGQSQSGGDKVCTTNQPEYSFLNGMGLPSSPNEVAIAGGGGRISADSSWEIEKYWEINHTNFVSPLDPNLNPQKAADRAVIEAAEAAYVAPNSLPSEVVIPTYSYPSSGSVTPANPSRRDVYTYEKINNRVADPGPDPNLETGTPACYKNYDLGSYSNPNKPRREIFAAVLNCGALEAEGDLNGRALDLPAEAFARMFMTKPVFSDGSTKEIYLEFVDVTGAGGNGTLENFLREEAELVR